jgi:hypothetical protein
MEWTTKKPELGGWYFWRQGPEVLDASEWEPFFAFALGPKSRQRLGKAVEIWQDIGDGRPEPVFEPEDGQWIGPMPMPGGAFVPTESDDDF